MCFLRTLKKQVLLFFLTLFILAVALRIWEPSYLIAALPQVGFFDYADTLAVFILIMPVSFLLYDSYEIELGLVCGVRTSKLLLEKFAALLIHVLLASFVTVGLYRYKEFVGVSKIIPIYIPEHYKVYMLISVFVVALFFASLLCLLRVASKNAFAPIGLGILIYTIFYGFNYDIHSGTRDIRLCLFDPFLSNYVLGDKVLTEYYKVGPLWTYNRLLFFGLAVGMLGVTYILLRREKLHQGFHD